MNFSKYLTTLFVLLCLPAALVFTGCKIDGPNDPVYGLDSNLIGTWVSEFDESYAITAASLVYDDGFGRGFAGTIRHVSRFTGNTGVIIIEYEAGREQTYPIYNSDWEIIGHNKHRGNFAGIYYENLKPGISVEMGNAVNLEDFSGAEETTLETAKAAFTSGRKGDYIGIMGVYLRKP